VSDKLIEIIDNCGSTDVYYGISGKGEKRMPLVDHGYIVKSYPNQNIDLSDFQKGRNIYIACQRIFDYLGIGAWMTANAISESGKLYLLKKRASELNMSPFEYLYSINIREVEKQFGFTMSHSVYFQKYKEYFKNA
jgi:hypothetical protein